MVQTVTLFARNLREIRTARGLTQEALAELANLSRVTIANFEIEDAFPRADTIDALAKALGVDASRLFHNPTLGQVPPRIAELIVELAREARIVDPATGSGSFLQAVVDRVTPRAGAERAPEPPEPEPPPPAAPKKKRTRKS